MDHDYLTAKNAIICLIGKETEWKSYENISDCVSEELEKLVKKIRRKFVIFTPTNCRCKIQKTTKKGN